MDNDFIYSIFKEHYKIDKPEISWLITASFHDMSYPLQLLDDWIDKFFEEVFMVKNIGHIELESSFVSKGFLRSFNYLMEQLCRVMDGDNRFCSKWLAEQDELLQQFYNDITGPKKNHCLLSVCSQRKGDNRDKNITDTLGVIALFPGSFIIVPSFY